MCKFKAWSDVEAILKEFRAFLDKDHPPKFIVCEPETLDEIWANSGTWPGAEYAGIYFILGRNFEILYIGKASGQSSIGIRLSTYFRSDPDDRKKWKFTLKLFIIKTRFLDIFHRQKLQKSKVVQIY